MTTERNAQGVDGLAEVMGLLGKATPGPWRECGHDRGGCVCGLIFSEPADAAVAITAIDDDELPKPMPGVPQANMQAIAAAVNYLRSHGEAIRELVSGVQAVIERKRAEADEADKVADNMGMYEWEQRRDLRSHAESLRGDIAELESALAKFPEPRP